ncbi:membrane protein, partial [Microbacterium sp. SUBG005]
LAWVSTYMIVTGVVYNLLLRGLPLQPETVGWSNEIMHVWGPLFLLLVLLGPGRRRLPWTAALGAAIFPIAWIVYTLVRAPLITNPTTGAPYWYPYPFLNPNEGGGWGSVAVYIVIIAVVIVGLAVGVVAIGRGRSARAI